MKWTRLELAILAWFIKITPNARIKTSRERHLLLTAIRIGLVGTVLGLSNFAVALGADWSTSTVLAIIAVALLALSNALLISAMILLAIISIIFGGQIPSHNSEQGLLMSRRAAAKAFVR